MVFLPYRRGSRKHAYIYFIIFALIVAAYVLSPSDQGKGSSVYYLNFSQVLFNLGLYCLLPADMHEKRDIGAVFFVVLPLVISLIAMVIFGMMFGSSLSDAFNGNTYLEVYWISYAAGIISGFGLFTLLRKRAKQYNEMIKKIIEG
jgi:hypothetical protein